MANVTTRCPVCYELLIVCDASDESVGIPFDYDVLEGSKCTCDWEDESTVKVISKYVEQAIMLDRYGDD